MSTPASMENRTPFIVLNSISMVLRAVRVALAAYVHKRLLDNNGFIANAFSENVFQWSELTLVGWVSFVTFLLPKSRICIRLGHVVMLWVFIVDLLSLSFGARQLQSMTVAGFDVDKSLIVLSALNIVATALSAVLFIYHCTFKDQHQNEPKMPQLQMGVTWFLTALNIALCVVRLALAADITETYSTNPSASGNNRVVIGILPFWTFTSAYGLVLLLTTFMYTMRWSRPTFYLQGIFLGFTFVLDFVCLGFAAKAADIASNNGEGSAFVALSILSAIVSFVQAFIHVWSSPAHPEPSGCKSFALEHMKLTGSDQQLFLGLGIPNLVLRVIRLGLVSDLWNKLIDGKLTVTRTALQVMFYTTWGLMGFAHGVSGHYFGYFNTKSTWMLHYVMLLLALAFDFGAGGYAVVQWVAGLTPGGKDNDELQALAALGLIQFVFVLIAFIVFVTKTPVPNDDDEKSDAATASATGGTSSVPLADA